MPLIKADRVKETSTSTGATTFALAGAVTGFRAFSSVCSVGDTFFYVIDSDSGSEWETGLGTYSAADTLTRTTVYASSNSGSIVTFSAGTKNVYISLTGRQIDTVSASPPASTGAPPLLESLAGAAHTALTASTEYNDIYWNLARTVQFSTGAITTQRSVRIAAPTYSFVAASTITTAATVQIDGAPVAGTNATISNTMALRIAGIAGTKGISLSSSTTTNNAANNAIEVTGGWGTGFQVRWSAGYTLIGSATHRDSTAQLSICQSLIAGTALSIANSASSAASDSMNVYNSSGTKVLIVTYNGCLTVQPGALSAVTPTPCETITGPAHTSLTASTEYSDVYWNLARTVEFAAGAITTQRAVRIAAPTYAFVAASTITDAVTFQIDGSPVAGTNATITNPIAFRVLTGQATGKGIVIQGAASQSANLQEWRNSSGVIFGSVNGNIQFSFSRNVNRSESFGNLANASGTDSVAVGYSSATSSTMACAIGGSSSASGQGTAIGYYSTASGSSSTALGAYATASSTYSIAIGALCGASASRSICIGPNMTNSVADSVKIGPTTNVLNAFYGTLQTYMPNATTIGSIIRGAASQTANLHEWQDSAGTALAVISANGSINIASSALSSGWVASQTITAPAHTALTASTEYNDIYWNLARTVQFSTGAIATQRAVRITAPTYSFVAASTITDAATVQIDGSPVAGTNATITNPIAFRVLTGQATGKGIVIQGAASQTVSLQEWQNSAGTTLAAVRFDGTIQPASLADSKTGIANNSIYYSTTSSKLVYKDPSGTVNVLY